MTNQQAPEALTDPSPDQLRAIARTARNSSGSASEDCGPLAYVLHGWRAAAIAFRAQQAALVDAKQPAPSAAAATKQEGEHLFELWWSEYMPEATQERAWKAWTEAPRTDGVGVAPPTPQADSAPLAAPADIVVLEAALRAIHQAIDLIGEPDTERLRTVRRVLRGAVVVAEDSTAPQADSQPAPVLDESAARDECKRRWLAEDEDCNLLEAYDRGWKDRAARAPADSVLEDAARLAKITQAIRDYHFALDNREHGGVAMARAWNAICDVLNMDWVQGAESAARKQGGKP